MNNEYIDQLNDIGSLLSTEKNLDVLMEKILITAKKLTNCDAGTFYLVDEDEQSLQFTVVQTDSLNIKMGGTAEQIHWPNLKLYNEDGTKNRTNISVNSVLNDELINVVDVYKDTKYNFEGAKSFDEVTFYRTTSMLVVPMKDHENDIIGVLQLINKKDDDDNFVAFEKADEKLITSLSSQAAISITSSRLVVGLEALLNAFIKSIATAIGEKSKYTEGHINRVAELSLMIAEAINEDKDGIYKDKNFSSDELKQLDVAAWMHDIGKITTPEYVVDKSKKLETIYDRINTVKVKFELIKKEKEISLLKKILVEKDENIIAELKSQYELELKELDDDFDFINASNTGGEFMSDDKIKRIEQIASKVLKVGDKEENLLDENEVYNLSIRKGTLTNEERDIINNHAKISFEMLDSLPFPKKLRDVPAMAGGHHEKISGKGYPFGLKGDEISFESRILAVADIFEALTASDRPYKEPNSLNQSIKILSFMIKDEELDGDLVKFFVDKGLHLEYAEDNLMPEQIDEVTIKF